MCVLVCCQKRGKKERGKRIQWKERTTINSKRERGRRKKGRREGELEVDKEEEIWEEAEEKMRSREKRISE
jgi:hypothetical protein